MTGHLRMDRGLRRHARNQGLTRQDAQFRFGPVEPSAGAGRKTPSVRSALGAALHRAGARGRKSAGMNVQVVVDPR